MPMIVVVSFRFRLGEGKVFAPLPALQAEEETEIQALPHP